MISSKLRRLTTLAAFAYAFAATASWAQQYTISTYAGGAWPTLPAAGTSVSIGYPRAVAPDGHGGVYFTSTGLNGVFKLDVAGILTVVAGDGMPSSWAQNPGTAAYIGTPQGLAVDTAGNLYFADTDTNSVRKIDTNGILTTVAGGGNLKPGDGQQATLAELVSPEDVALDGAGNLYIADTFNHGRVRKVDTHGIITTVAGTGSLMGSAVNGQPAAQAYFSRPTGLAVDGAGNLYIADAGLYYVYRIDPKGIITVWAGNGTLTFTGAGGPATSAGICAQGSLGADAAGNLYIPDTLTNSIRKVDTLGILTTVAGSPGSLGFAGDGGPATSAILSSPADAAPDTGGVLWIADSSNFRVRKVDAAGVIATVAGLSGWSYAGDGGQATSAQLSAISGVALDAAGNLFIADTNNVRIREVSKAGIITTVAGSGIMGSSGDGGPATSAQLFAPSSVAVDPTGNVYVGDLGEARRVDTNGNILSVVTTAACCSPSVAVDAAGNLYVADSNRVRKIDKYGSVTPVAGSGTAGYSGDGGPATWAQLSNPVGTALDPYGNLYIADFNNARIRKVDPAGTITTVAGNGTYGYSGDGGPATSAQLLDPAGVAVDSAGELVIADGTHVRRVDKAGIITSIASGLNGAVGIAATAGGYLYVAESNNMVVRRLAPTIPDLTVAKMHAGNFAPGQTGAVYTITVSNAGGSPTSGTVALVDTLPAKLTATAMSGTGWSCALATLTCTRTDALAAGAKYPAITLTVNVAPDAPASVINTAAVSGGGETYTANDTALDPTSVIGVPDLTIAKTHAGNFTPGQSVALYTITVGNAGTGPTSGMVTLIDTLPAKLTATAMSGTGWSCTLSTLTCTRTDALAAAANYPAITLTVNVAFDAPSNVTNTATVSGGGETNTSNDTASDPTYVGLPADLTVAKTHTGDFAPGQTGAVYSIIVSNVGTGPTNGTVTLIDTLPAKLTATAMSGTGWNCTLGTLACTRTDALAAGAKYPAITLTVNVAPDAPASVTNTATVSGGGETNTANDTASDPTFVGQGPDLAVTKAHAGNFAPGQTGAVYTITVSNVGNGPTTGTVTLTDALPAKLTATAMSGANWKCTLATRTCTRTDTLAAGASYPAITLTVNVAADAPASVTNAATVSGGGETNTANDTALDPASVVWPADMTVTATHAGNFTQGQTGAVYALSVANTGAGATVGTVTVTDTLPAKLTATAMGGIGWSCTLSTLTCTRSDVLAAAASYPAVTLTVNVAGDAPASVTNVATVSGGGETNTGNDAVADTTTIVQRPDLTVAKTHSGAFTQGQAGAAYTIVVSNAGGAATSGTVTLVDALPAKLAATAMSGAGWSCALPTLTCTRSDALAAGAIYPAITLTVNVAADAPASVTNTATVSGGGETNAANDTASDPTSITQHPDLAVAKTHAGNFAQGQTGAVYTITVSNAGTGSTSGTVTLLDTLPGKLAATAIRGTGWSCTLSTLTCTRSDTLAAGAAYPAITLTVNVAADAPASVINSATVSGGGEANTANDTAADVTAITPVVVCSYALGSGSGTFPAAGGSGTVAVTVGAGCSWTASSTLGWVTLTAPASGSGNGSVGFTVAPNTGSARSGTIVIAGLSFTVQQVGASAANARFVPVAPCRIADTRAPAGPFGGPAMAAASTRSFAIPQSACAIPATALAYSLNVTVVPKGVLSYLTLWPTGQSQPLVSTLNSFQGAVVANAAIVPAGTNGAVNVYVTDGTDVILDIDGYFDAGGGANSVSFYPAPPCRMADTRMSSGPFGGPSMSAGQSRDFPLASSSCVPAAAKAYSLNVTVVPGGYLGYLTTWPAGQPQPNASTLNSWTGKVVANAAIVPAGTNGAISVFVPNPTDVILDSNGYFAPPGSPGALSFYPVTPCRVADTRNSAGPFGGPTMDAGTTRSFAIPASGCFVPSTAAAYSVNVTVVPQGPLSYLTTWPAGSAQPLVSTLNSFDGSVVANAALVPAGTGGAINVFVTGRTDVVIDINGYFAP